MIGLLAAYVAALSWLSAVVGLFGESPQVPGTKAAIAMPLLVRGAGRSLDPGCG
ncbi:hypothetical protein ACIOKD_36225 [Streptomyces sp. NPDC087844]|uniref:hypothetical protein n=1 Tax=Streptomyces sp. NPDC087844 TaxID=3365805 RepID=UPI0037F56F45